jgi:hypothetical protein
MSQTLYLDETSLLLNLKMHKTNFSKEQKKVCIDNKHN